MVDTKDLKAQAEEALDKVKAAGADVSEKFKESGAGKALLGEDGKLGKDDFSRFGESIKNSAAGKAVLGEDGKFDKEDISRIAGSAAETAKKGVDAVKGLFGMKDEPEAEEEKKEEE